MPTRALIGYRDLFLTDTKGTGMHELLPFGLRGIPGRLHRPLHRLAGLRPERQWPSPTACTTWSRAGRLFVVPGDPVYEGMIVGEHNLDSDLNVNPAKAKKLSNMRSVLKDEALTLTPIQPMTLERAIQFIRDDEMVEVTPRSIRIRKEVLTFQDRKTAYREAAR